MGKISFLILIVIVSMEFKLSSSFDTKSRFLSIFSNCLNYQEPSLFRGNLKVYGGGFGVEPLSNSKSKNSKSSKGSKKKLDDESKKILKEANGDLNLAQSIMFNNRIKALQKKKPELFDKEFNQIETNLELHEQLVEFTWDTVASYLPLQEDDIEKSIQNKLNSIASCCIKNVNDNNHQYRILDVGCGDGTILPYLQNCIKTTANGGIGSSQLKYVGIDLSGKFIDDATNKFKRNKDYKFIKCNFMNQEFDDSIEERDTNSNNKSNNENMKFDCILFNGSLQFFKNTEEVIDRALSLLSANGCIIISHVNGASFVRDEMQGNPHVVLSEMPSVRALQQLKSTHDLQVLSECHMLKETLSQSPTPSQNLEEFYLIGLQRNPS